MIDKAVCILLLWATSFNVFCQGLISVSVVKVEGMHSPTGVHLSDFRFSWNLNSNEHNQVQRAYEIKMYSDKACTSLAWTSGVVKSSASINVKYSGKSLLPGASYYWQVRVWDTNNKASNWSKPDRFITELSEADWQGAKWIAFETMGDSSLIDPGVHAPYVSTLGRKGIKRYTVPFFRKAFGVKRKIQEALVFVSGMGHYELSINGMKVHDSFIAPGWTAYSKRSLYNTYDVTRFLTEGKNAIGITVGNGFFNINRERYFKLITAYGPPQAVCRLWIKYDDNSTESIVTNNEWRTSQSPTTFSSIYGGEDYDARLEQRGWDTPEFNDGLWQQAIEVSGRGRLLSPEVSYPVKIMESIPAKGIRKLSETTYLYDFGQNTSGVVRLRVKGKKGQVVKLSPAELVKGDRIQQGASGEPCYFIYTLKGDSVEEWVPKFTYYGFRYVEVDGARPLSVEKNDAHPTIVGLSLEHNRNSTPQVGSFECSNQLFNQINNLIIWAIKSNMQSTITDCPHREKLGWLEQDYLMGESIQFNYDIFSLYKKITYDMMDAQRKDGLVPDIAPELVVFEGGFLDSPEWGSSAVLVPWLIYKNYGDDKILRDAYPMMKNYVRYLEGKAKNNLLSHGLGDWFDYGPNSPGEAQLTPKMLTATSIYYYDVTLMQHIAALLANKADAAYYDKLAKQVKDSFNKQFFDRGAKLYSTGSQTAMAMPLCVGLVDDAYKDAVVANLVETVRKSNYALTAGDIGFHFLVRALSENNQSQVIFDMNARNDVPGYGFQLAKGATALTESWPALESVSNNHLMLGHIMEWFYNGVLGITQSEGSLGYKNIVIKPQVVGDLTWAKGSFLSPYGTVLCDWRLNGDLLLVDVEVPVNTTAQVVLPADHIGTLKMNGESLSMDGTSKARLSGDKFFIPVGSGRYSFSLEKKRK